MMHREMDGNEPFSYLNTSIWTEHSKSGAVICMRKRVKEKVHAKRTKEKRRPELERGTMDVHSNMHHSKCMASSAIGIIECTLRK